MDWATVSKLLGAAWVNLGSVGLLLVVLYDRWKAGELKGKDAQLAAKDEQIKILERHCKLLEERSSKVLMDHHKAVKEGLEQAVVEEKKRVQEKEERIHSVQSALDRVTAEKTESTGAAEELKALLDVTQVELGVTNEYIDHLTEQLGYSQKALDALAERHALAIYATGDLELIRPVGEAWQALTTCEPEEREFIGGIVGRAISKYRKADPPEKED
jgi:hypothetical protein